MSSTCMWRGSNEPDPALASGWQAELCFELDEQELQPHLQMTLCRGLLLCFSCHWRWQQLLFMSPLGYPLVQPTGTRFSQQCNNHLWCITLTVQQWGILDLLSYIKPPKLFHIWPTLLWLQIQLSISLRGATLWEICTKTIIQQSKWVPFPTRLILSNDISGSNWQPPACTHEFDKKGRL